jgi:tetratricopeptide (TPR) repeat protein
LERFEEAAESFGIGIEKDPKNPDFYFQLGTTYDKLNRFENVIASMEKAIELNPKHSMALNYLGYSFADRGIRLDEAVDLIKRALEVRPDDGYYIDSLGWAYYKQGNLKEALKELKRAVDLVPDDPVLREHLGDIYLGIRKGEKAKDEWLKSLEIDPSNEKLMDKYQGAGFGDPRQEERLERALKQKNGKKEGETQQLMRLH